MSQKVGRPITLNHEAMHAAILQHKADIVDNGALVPKKAKVWSTIGDILNKSGQTIYSYVANNRMAIKELLIPTNYTEAASPKNRNTSLNTSENTSIQEKQVFIYLSKAEFDDLLLEKVYKRTEQARPNLRHRNYLVLKRDTWQSLIIKRLDEHGIKCGFQFKTHKIHPASDIATFSGACDCGSSLRGEILSLRTEVIKVACYISENITGHSCGKRYLRGDERIATAKYLAETGKLASVYRIEKAEECMKIGDEQEPAFLPKRTVLNQAKSEENKRLLVDKDPLRALEILKCQDLKSIIQSIGLYPFFVHYWSISQLNVYRAYVKENKYPTVFIDATGGLVKRLDRPDRSKSGPLLLYNCVVNTGKKEECNQYPVAQMISESHTTNNIMFWLMEWNRSGAPPPREVVCDSSKALLNAVVRAFSNYNTLQEYADSCTEGCVPLCYIRIDVAHVINIYAKFLRDKHRGIKNLYLGAIAELILCQNLQDAATILRLILTICRSTYQGLQNNGKETKCSIAKEKLKQILIKNSDDADGNKYLTGNKVMNSVLENFTGSQDLPDDDSQEEEDDEELVTSYTAWISDIDANVKENIDQNGEDINAHKHDALADKLVKHCSIIPVWTCINKQKFGYGRIPASSAPVESDMNDLKNRAFKGKSIMRIDNFVKHHIKYIQGRNKIIKASNTQTKKYPAQQENYLEPLQIEDGTIGNPQDYNEQGIPEDAECPACKNGDLPTGAHKCAVCCKSVHIFEQCSLPLPGEEEGYGEKRLCVECGALDKGTLEAIVTSGYQENWRGLVTEPPKKRAKYVKGTFHNNDFKINRKLHNIPLLRNGNVLNLQPISIKNKYYTIVNTCAFDSIVHLYLVIEMDKLFIENLNLQDEPFFKMILDISRKGVNANAYKTRAIILKDSALCTISKLTGNSYEIQSTANIGDIVNEIFKKIPTLVINTYCDKCCFSTTVTQTVITVEDELLNLGNSTFQMDLQEKFFNNLQEVPCKEDSCNGTVHNELETTGYFIILDVCATTYRPTTVALRTIALEIDLLGVGSPYVLKGLVHFKAPTSTSFVTEETTGHYITYSRRSNTWFKIDDLENTTTKVNKNTMVQPSLIVYEKVNR